MHKHLDREMENLKKLFMSLSTLVEENFFLATKAFKELNAEAARQAIENDFKIDDMEIQVEEECLKMLALYQPVAIDLRFIISILKINSDIERIGDLAVNIAKCSVYLSEHPPIEVPPHFALMIQKTQVMLEKSLVSLVNLDPPLAYEVCYLDDEVDELKNDQEQSIVLLLQKNPEQAGSLLRLLSVARYIERIADHVTNIAEDVIYSVEGDIIRHHTQSRDVAKKTGTNEE